MRILRTIFIVLLSFGAFACAATPGEPAPGPDKQAVGMATGGAIGAGAGAVIGHNLILAGGSMATGPGAFIGAGLGVVAGLFKGLGIDLLEEDQLRRQAEERALREMAWVQEVLTEHYQRRLELHPNRDIFPADLFFDGDAVKIKNESKLLIWHLAKLTKNRMPWSRIVVAAYATSASDDGSSYARYLTEKRAKEIALQFIRGGIEPRRVTYRAVTLNEPILIDPDDSEHRYRQAIEIIPLDF